MDNTNLMEEIPPFVAQFIGNKKFAPTRMTFTSNKSETSDQEEFEYNLEWYVEATTNDANKSIPSLIKKSSSRLSFSTTPSPARSTTILTTTGGNGSDWLTPITSAPTSVYSTSTTWNTLNDELLTKTSDALSNGEILSNSSCAVLEINNNNNNELKVKSQQQQYFDKKYDRDGASAQPLKSMSVTPSLASTPAWYDADTLKTTFSEPASYVMRAAQKLRELFSSPIPAGEAVTLSDTDKESITTPSNITIPQISSANDNGEKMKDSTITTAPSSVLSSTSSITGVMPSSESSISSSEPGHSGWKQIVEQDRNIIGKNPCCSKCNVQ